jgi:hypothetical protein
VSSRPPGLADDVLAQIGRFLELAEGGGFQLGVVELGDPAQREALAAWLCDRVGAGSAVVDLGTLSGHNLWAELKARYPDPLRLGVVTGWERAVAEADAARGDALQMVNVQRDVLARDFPWRWLVVASPAVFETAAISRSANSPRIKSK